MCVCVPVHAVFSKKLIPKTSKRTRLDDGRCPEYLRQPTIYGLDNFSGTSYNDMDHFNATGLGFKFKSKVI